MDTPDPTDTISEPLAHSVESPVGFDFFPSAVVQLQKRGTITLPPGFRPEVETSTAQRLWLRLGPEESLCLDPLWSPDQLFSRYDARAQATNPKPPSSPLPTRWLDATTILTAQTDPQHPARAWCHDCDAGFHAVQMDPVVLPDLLQRLPTILPSLTRPAIARYVASVCSWTGVTLVDRNFYLAVLALWGASETEWSFLVQRARESEPS